MQTYVRMVMVLFFLSYHTVNTGGNFKCQPQHGSCCQYIFKHRSNKIQCCTKNV